MSEHRKSRPDSSGGNDNRPRRNRQRRGRQESSKAPRQSDSKSESRSNGRGSFESSTRDEQGGRPHSKRKFSDRRKPSNSRRSGRPSRPPKRRGGRDFDSSFAPREKRIPELPDDIPELAGAFTLLPKEIRAALGEQDYQTPTAIQEQSIPPILEGNDLLGSAQTGTGKTAAFVLPLLKRLLEDRQRNEPGFPRALILAPTRELAGQIGDSIYSYAKYTPLSHTVIFGGVKQSPQVRAMQNGVDILVATPGRLLDLMEQGVVMLEKTEYFILDEVDRMLDMGFIPDINRILKIIPEDRQTLFFSATMAGKVKALAETMVYDPVRIVIEPGKPAVDRIKQSVLFLDKSKKTELLCTILESEEVHKAIVFIQMKHQANRVSEILNKAGIRNVAIHGNKSQGARNRALNEFKNGRYDVMIATDVAARGLDVDDITHVINYDLPNESETYVHRIGRTARAGAEGTAISFCSADELGFLREIQSLLKEPIPVNYDQPFHVEKLYDRSKSRGSSSRKPSNRGSKTDYRNKSRRSGGNNSSKRRNRSEAGKKGGNSRRPNSSSKRDNSRTKNSGRRKRS